MKKIMMLLLMFVFVAAACGNANDNDGTDGADNNQAVNDETENENGEETAADQENNANDNIAENEETNNNENHAASENSGEEVADDQSVEEQLKDLTANIFAAQNEEDYDYLKSILAEGNALDKDGNTFHFVDGDYEHDMEFVQEDTEHLEYRFVHESDENNVYVGYGVINEETESSYAIEFQFVKEDGEWKMKDMDKDA